MNRWVLAALAVVAMSSCSGNSSSSRDASGDGGSAGEGGAAGHGTGGTAGALAGVGGAAGTGAAGVAGGAAAAGGNGAAGNAAAGAGASGGNTSAGGHAGGAGAGAGEGQVCSGSVPCGPGLFCLAMSASISTCAKFCDSDADCTAPGGSCNKTVGDSLGGTIPGVKLCTENCDPVTNVGCPVAGTSCQDSPEFSRSSQAFTDCMPAGTKTQNAACNPTVGECAPGFGCFFNAAIRSVCMRYCDLASPCSAGLTCGTLSAGTVGNVEYGICY